MEWLQDHFCIHTNMNISLSVNVSMTYCSFMHSDVYDGGYPRRYFFQNDLVTWGISLLRLS
ncbi:hypothetical protein SEVIR_5G220600v4 [Setaria viridis]|uniref:Uncharacterized protein n=1 Tax=Setaria viridis TaxID=4556 RepID=A0A4U6UGG4_SETVI|nr:hypothetical protein SEVIR_5G220600v2 [Setaria viridis]